MEINEIRPFFVRALGVLIQLAHHQAPGMSTTWIHIGTAHFRVQKRRPNELPDRLCYVSRNIQRSLYCRSHNMLTIYTINQLQHLDKELFERVNLQLIQLLVHYLQLILQPVDLVYDRSFTRLRHINIRHVTRGKRNLTLRTSRVLGNNFTSCSNGTLVICNSPSSSGSLFAISSA